MWRNIVELIYFWINKTDNNILENQDVMISGEYYIKFDKEKRFLKIKENTEYYNVFKNNVISNVNAIVGSNGAGKTTLLEYIYRINIQTYMVPTGERMSEYDIDMHEKWTTIQVYKEENKLFIIHNIKKGINITQSEFYKVINTNDDIKYGCLEEIIPITKIYLSNSYYNYGINGYSSAYDMPTNIALTIQSLKTFSNDFYSNSVNFPEGLIGDNLYNGLQQIIISKRTENNFQQVCDLLYFNKLYKEQKAEKFIGKVSTDFIIQSEPIISILNKIQNSREPINRYNSQIDYRERIKDKFSTWKKNIEKFKYDGCEFIETLEVNLLLELDFIYNIFEKGKMSIDNNVLKFCSSNLYIIENDQEKKYYVSAINEIYQLRNIVKKFQTVKNISLSYQDKKEEYIKFLDFIERVVKNKQSFIIKYLNILNLKMSSGERAFLNFFSWINLIQFFKHISSHHVFDSTAENILILIDEIDLYCHPEWQRKMIKNTLEELKNQFQNKKIQVIFTTHSPIVLSDIPLNNTLYIRKIDDLSSKIDDRSVHKETFASNIYQLFNDSFFISAKSAIGEYALGRINSILSKIKDGDVEDGLDEIDSILDIIGEPIIRNKLTNMLNKKIKLKNIRKELKPLKNNLKDNENDKLIKIKKRVEELLNDINKSIE